MGVKFNPLTGKFDMVGESGGGSYNDLTDKPVILDDNVLYLNSGSGLEPIMGLALNIYVSTTGDDANDGLTPETPKLTFQGATEAIPADYAGNIIVNLASGNIQAGSAPVVEGKYPSGNFTITIKGANLPTTGETLDLVGSSYTNTDRHLTISGATWIEHEHAGKALYLDGTARSWNQFGPLWIPILDNGADWIMVDGGFDAWGVTSYEPELIVAKIVECQTFLQCEPGAYTGLKLASDNIRLENFLVEMNPSGGSGIDNMAMVEITGNNCSAKCVYIDAGGRLSGSGSLGAVRGLDIKGKGFQAFGVAVNTMDFIAEYIPYAKRAVSIEDGSVEYCGLSAVGSYQNTTVAIPDGVITIRDNASLTPLSPPVSDPYYFLRLMLYSYSPENAACVAIAGGYYEEGNYCGYNGGRYGVFQATFGKYKTGSNATFNDHSIANVKDLSIYPDQAGKSGKVLTTNGTTPSWGFPAHNHSDSDNGGFIKRFLSNISSETTLDNTFETILADATGGAFNVYLPSASSVVGREFTIIKQDNAFDITLIPLGEFSLTTWTAGAEEFPYPDWALLNYGGGIYTGASVQNFVVELDGESGGADTFKWSKDGGSTWEATGIVVDFEHTLVDGVKFYFPGGNLNSSGYYTGDKWEFTATPNKINGSGSYVLNTQYQRVSIISSGGDYYV